MQEDAYLKCVHPKCGLVYPISSTNVQCENGHVLDVKYKNTPSTKLKDTFYERRNSKGSIFNESGIWRFRELLNFCQIDTESLEECSKFLVSLDGAEGRQSKPYHMSKAAEFLGIEKEEANNEIFNVGTGVAIDVLAVANTLIQEYKIDVPVEVTGKFRLGDIRHNYADMSKIKDFLDFEPKVFFEKGIDRKSVV